MESNLVGVWSQVVSHRALYCGQFSNIFISDQDEGIECFFSHCTSSTNVGGISPVFSSSGDVFLSSRRLTKCCFTGTAATGR